MPGPPRDEAREKTTWPWVRWVALAVGLSAFGAVLMVVVFLYLDTDCFSCHVSDMGGSVSNAPP